MFVLSPEMLMIDATLLEIGLILVTALAGMIAIGAGIIGYWYRKLNVIERILSVLAGFLLIYPEGISDTVGFIMFVVLFIIQFITRDKSHDKVKAAPVA
jgi:TRAP-type uncharacterized transport system fused permease subunit